jgi:histidine ammonia-lyase
LDLATAVIADMASISERRVAQLVDPHLNRGLPPFLAQNPGLNSGFMMAQVTAASLVSEAKVLAHPKSVDSIPTSADREDHVSMGMTAARHLREVVDIYSDVLSIEAVVAAHAVSLRGPDPAPSIHAACALLAEVVPPITGDRAWHLDFKAARALVTSGALLAAADEAAG